MLQTEKDRIEFLTSAFLERGLTAKEKDELKNLLQEPAMHAYFKESYSIWNAKYNKGYDTENAYRKVLSAIGPTSRISNKPRRRVWSIWMPRVAASLLAFLLGMGSFYLIETRISPNPDETFLALQDSVAISRIKVPLGSKSQVDLPDGTVVILNAGSQLEYTTHYGKELRKVKLEGEGYFQVAKNEHCPFIVSAKKAEIKAIGTAFNVKAYSDEDYVQTTLVEGAVSIRPDKISKRDKEILLKPNEMLTIRELNKQTTLEKENITDNTASSAPDIKRLETKISTQIVDPIIYTSWKDKRWVIDSEEMESLVLKLERRYDVSITIVGKELEKYKFSGIFQNETLEQVLEIMKSIAPINYTINKKSVVLTINPNQRKIFERSMVR